MNTFIKRVKAAEGKEDYGNNEGSEINNLPITERIVWRRGLFGMPEAQDKQQLVAGVGQRMDRLCHHGARTGK